MDFGGGGGQTVKSTPWIGGQPYLFNVLNRATGLYGRTPPGAYSGERVAELNPYQTGAIDWQAERAMAGNPLTDAAQQAVLGQAGGVPNPTYDFLSGTMMNPYAGSGQALPAAYGDIARAGMPNPAMGMLGQTASGAYVGANPYLDASYNRAAERLTDVYRSQTLPNLQAQATRAGGLGAIGSPGYQEAMDLTSRGLERGLADLGTGIYGGAYGQERANQLAAQQALGSQYLAGLSGQRAATGQLGQLGGMGLGQQLGAAGQLGGQFQADLARQLQASQIAPSLAREDYFDIGQLGSAGGLLQQQRQRELDAQRQAWEDANFGPGSPSGWLQNYANIVYPGVGMGGQVTQPGASPAGGILAGGLGGLAAASAFGLPMSSPWTIGLGLGGGILGGLF